MTPKPQPKDTKEKEVLSNNIKAIPEGQIGKLYILKSGQVKMKIGDVTFDVSQGMPCEFLQELVGLNTKEKDFYQLGNVNRRMIISPDISSLL